MGKDSDCPKLNISKYRSRQYRSRESVGLVENQICSRKHKHSLMICFHETDYYCQQPFAGHTGKTGHRTPRGLKTHNVSPIKYSVWLKVHSCKLYNNKYMIVSMQIANTEIFTFKLF